MRQSSIWKWFSILVLVGFTSCSPSAFISKQAKSSVFNSPDLNTAHIGIAIYDAVAGKYLYNYQANKYFVPASNVKLFSCYAAMKYLGDSITGIYYSEDDTAIYLLPAGDPTFLHKDFTKQPVIDFLKATKKNIYITDSNWNERQLGFGWSWDDYNSDYMAERSPLPVYGNLVHWVQERDTTIKVAENEMDNSVSIYSLPEVNWKVRFNPESGRRSFYVRRERAENNFFITQGSEAKKEQDVPFVTNSIASAVELLPDTIGKQITQQNELKAKNLKFKTIHSGLLDSLLRPMMHRSDNFFAEQVLLMVSQQLLGMMNDAKAIDTILKTSLKDLPQKPRWVDGSGLSRYNMFSPQDFVWLLDKMKNEFGLERMKIILPTGGEGTLQSYYRNESGLLFAKTGTLASHLALSGYLYTKKNKLLIFSVLVNNHNGSVTNIRRQVELFLRSIRNRF